ncbi:hypothetical protein HDU96_000031 [Phlyctochytrium bullatum]|nr:hypothetical protein HDU96_000031 [Phlyctochytrium bullatum]
MDVGDDNQEVVREDTDAVDGEDAEPEKVNGHGVESDQPPKKKDGADGKKVQPRCCIWSEVSRNLRKGNEQPSQDQEKDAAPPQIRLLEVMLPLNQTASKRIPTNRIAIAKNRIPRLHSTFRFVTVKILRMKLMDAVRWMTCEKATGKRSVWKQTCEAYLYSMREKESENPFEAAPSCNKYIEPPSSQSTNGKEAVEEFLAKSRYCSQECGLAVARHRLLAAFHKGLIPKRPPVAKPEPDNLLEPLPPEHIQAYKSDEEADLESLRRSREARHGIYQRIKHIEARIGFLEACADRAEVAAVETQEMICGFDSRIVLYADDPGLDLTNGEPNERGMLPSMCPNREKRRETWKERVAEILFTYDTRSKKVGHEKIFAGNLVGPGAMALAFKGEQYGQRAASDGAPHLHLNKESNVKIIPPQMPNLGSTSPLKKAPPSPPMNNMTTPHGNSNADSKRTDHIPSAANQAAFIHKLYTMLEDLNMYGFHKINDTFYKLASNSEVWEFKHPDFRRGEIDLLQNIKRKAPSKAGSSKAAASVTVDPDKTKDEKIEMLANKVIELEEKLAKLHESNIDILQAEVAKISPASYANIDQPGSPRTRMNPRPPQDDGQEDQFHESDANTRSASVVDDEEEDIEEDSQLRQKRQRAKVVVRRLATLADQTVVAFDRLQPLPLPSVKSSCEKLLDASAVFLTDDKKFTEATELANAFGEDNGIDFIVVLVKNQIFKIPVVSDNGKRLGLLELKSLNDANAATLSAVKNALFVVALDDTSSRKEFPKQIFHNYGNNRWFDKSLQLVVSSDGRAGLNIDYDDKRAAFAEVSKTLHYERQNVLAGHGFRNHLLALQSVARQEERRQQPIKLFQNDVVSNLKRLDIVALRVNSSNKLPCGLGSYNRHGYGVTYSVDQDSIRGIVSYKRGALASGKEFLETLERTIKDMTILFPKRSDVWGKGWRERHERERKEEYQLKVMRLLSDQYVSRKSTLAWKYNRK